MANGELGFTGEATPASPQVGGVPGVTNRFIVVRSCPRPFKGPERRIQSHRAWHEDWRGGWKTASPASAYRSGNGTDYRRPR
jgi:hypothetical protein